MLNEPHNAETSGAISTDASRATVRVIRTDEELMIARSVCRTLGPGVAATVMGDAAITVGRQEEHLSLPTVRT
jgi:hypothetical protein